MRRALRTPCLAVFLVATLGPSHQPLLHARAGDQQAPQAEDDLARYRSLVTQFVGGDADAVPALLGWNDRRLRAAVGKAAAGTGAHADWFRVRGTAAAMFHSESAWALFAAREPQKGFQHLELAALFFDVATPEGRDFAGRWYRVVARQLRELGEPELARRLLALGRGRVPDHPLILLASATVEEWLATARTLRQYPATLRLRETAVAALNARRRQHLDAAVGYLQAAVRLEPVDPLALVHLGRAEALLGREAVAGRAFESVLQATSGEAPRYLALLFLGAIDERRGRLDEATRRYQQALETLPGQAARVALAHVLQRTGQGDAARALMGNLLEGGEIGEDPWWAYYFGGPGLIGEEWGALLEEALR